MTDESPTLMVKLAGMQFAFPKSLHARLAGNPESLQTLVGIATQAKELESKTGAAFNDLILINDSDFKYGFSTQMAVDQEDKAQAYLSIPVAALEATPAMDKPTIEGILAHELGHAAQKEQSRDLRGVFFWAAPLTDILASAVVLRQNPGVFKELTAPAGGEEAFLEKVDSLFAQVQDGLKDFLAKTTTNGEANSPEKLIDALATDKHFAPILKKAANFGNDNPALDYEVLNDAADPIVQAAYKQGLIDSNLEISKETAPEEQVNLLKLLNGLRQNVNHAQEYMADDFATQHVGNPISHLKRLHTDIGEFDSDSHPRISLRIERADRLDTCRITMLDTTSEINEAAAVKRVNREMEKFQQKPAEKQASASRA